MGGDIYTQGLVFIDFYPYHFSDGFRKLTAKSLIENLETRNSSFKILEEQFWREIFAVSFRKQSEFLIYFYNENDKGRNR